MAIAAGLAVGRVAAGLGVLGSMSKAKKYGLIGAVFLAGVGSTDPVEHAIGEFEEHAMGDPNFSKKILGRPMGGYGLLAGLGTIGPMSSSVRNSYIGRDLLSNAITQKQVIERNAPPGSMVFGMFNSRMS